MEDKEAFFRRNWKRIVIVVIGIFLLPAPLLFSVYLGFWLGRYTVGLRVIRNQKVKLKEKEEKPVE